MVAHAQLALAYILLLFTAMFTTLIKRSVAAALVLVLALAGCSRTIKTGGYNEPGREAHERPTRP